MAKALVGGPSQSQANVASVSSRNIVGELYIDSEIKDMVMVFIRIKNRFRHRASEWFCALNLLLWGVVMLHPSSSFASSQAYAAFERTVTEEHMASALTALGLLWLAGLIVNGAREKATSLIRATCAAAGGVIYFTMALGFLSSYFITGVLTAGITTYVLISALSFYSLYWIAKDKRALAK